MTATHHLTPAERASLSQANAILTALTESHCHACECHLCEARMLTDVQEEDAYHVTHLPAANPDN